MPISDSKSRRDTPFVPSVCMTTRPVARQGANSQAAEAATLAHFITEGCSRRGKALRMKQAAKNHDTARSTCLVRYPLNQPRASPVKEKYSPEAVRKQEKISMQLSSCRPLSPMICTSEITENTNEAISTQRGQFLRCCAASRTR